MNKTIQNFLKKKENIVISGVITLFLLVSFYSLMSIHKLHGNARVVNYVGIVRGATQKLVKKELLGYQDDTLIARLDSIINELINGFGPNNLIVLYDSMYMDTMQKVKKSWINIKEEIKLVRNGKDRSDLYALSESYFSLVDSAVSAAESFSEKQVSHSISLLLAVNAAFILLLIIGIMFIIRTRTFKKHAEILNNIAYLDQLTGLINNAGISDAATDFITHNEINGCSFVYMDIIAFSRINDLFGYSAGDLVLRIISGVIREHFFCGARITADRFAFFCKIVEENVEADIEALFYDAIEKEMGKEYLQLIAFKFGIFPLGHVKPTFRQVYDGALLALKNAKKQNKLNKVVYDAELKCLMDLRKNLEINMLRALQKKEFLMYIQPQFTASDEQCCGGEALIRWQSESMGLIQPDNFIPLFESNGFIVETDFFMLESALKLLQTRISKGEKLCTIAVNQSKVTISFSQYLKRMKELVVRYPEAFKYIEIEITESTIENELDTIIPLMHNLKEIGFTIALDDFGSGFSSLNTLRVLPIDVLKIDKAFLQESDTSERSKCIIMNIINLAKDLKIKIVCEGVETATQFAFLKAASCDTIQGFYFSKPIPDHCFIKKYMDCIK